MVDDISLDGIQSLMPLSAPDPLFNIKGSTDMPYLGSLLLIFIQIDREIYQNIGVFSKWSRTFTLSLNSGNSENLRNH